MRTLFQLVFAATVVLLSACQNNCRNISCENNGNCQEGECICPKWYSGDRCQLLFNRNYEGIYVGQENAQSRLSNNSWEIVADENIPNRLYMPNGGHFDFETEAEILIRYQQVVEGNDTFIIEGSGTYREEELTLVFTKYKGDEEKQPVSFQGRLQAEEP